MRTLGVHVLALSLSLIPVTLSAQDPKPRPDPTSPRATRPPAPANVTAMITAPGEVTVRWDSVPGASAYDIGRLAPPAGWVRAERVTGGTLVFVDRERRLSVPHTYQVVAIAGALASMPGRSEAVQESATSPATPLAAPCNGQGDVRVCYVSREWTGDAVGSITVDVGCPSSAYQLLSGGYTLGATRYRVVESRPSIYNAVVTWKVSVARVDAEASAPESRGSVTAFANCRLLR